MTGDNTNVDLSTFLDNTDEQQLALAGNVLSITNGNSVDLSALAGAGDTDDQTLSISGNSLSISGGNTVSLSSVNTDNQTLTLANDQLSISGGNVIDLSAFLDNSDMQLLAFDNATGELEISNGNTITLPISSGGDNWGTQVAATDNTMDGYGTSANP